MITNKQSYLTGYMVGCRLREGRPAGVMGEPVAWMYNGVRLPRLPEYDATVYPYVTIARGQGMLFGQAVDYVRLVLTSAPTVVYVNLNDISQQLTAIAPYKYYMIDYIKGETDWNLKYEGNDNVPYGVADELIFANHDVYYNDRADNGDLAGTIYLAKSEPVPVYA